MPLLRGTRLGTYEILDPLGAGGMGEVYRARDTRLRRDVAVKVLPAEVASSPDWLARFEREARIVAGLNHPNIVTLFSVEDEDGVRFLTMELVEGQTLSDLVTPGGLPFSRVLELSIPLTEALVAAHERGVVHRDLKPGNVMVTRDGRVKVLDFGLAKVAPVDERSIGGSVTVTANLPVSSLGQAVGTVPYMAPEQLRGEVVDARSDLFALGITLYELAAGRRPFRGDTFLEVGSSILRDTPEPLTRVRTDIPNDFEGIVSQCLEKIPRERVQTALDVSNALRRLRRGSERGRAEGPSGVKVPSIAVLPFVNRSRDEEDEYFSDGLADELLNLLAKIRGLRVLARASSFQFKGKNEDLAAIGARLNVATVLDGSVRKAGNRLRISVQLVNVSDGCHLWSETYDRAVEDIFAVQDDIAQSVVGSLAGVLLDSEAGSRPDNSLVRRRVEPRSVRDPDPEAFRLVLQGRYFVGRGNPADLAKGIGYLQSAVKLDPACALAWAQLGAAYSTEVGHGLVSTAGGYARGREAVERALELDPDLAEGHATMGWLKMRSNCDFLGAEASLRRAQELAPGDVKTLNVLAVLARSQGRLDEAIVLHQRCCQLDPISSNMHHNLGHAYYAADRLAEAESSYRTALELSPNRDTTRALLAVVVATIGRHKAALADATQEPDDASRVWALAVIHATAGRLSESDEALRSLIDKHADQEAYRIAQVFATRQEGDRAFEWLERAYTQHVGGLINIRASPHLRSLHGDPRWGAFLKKMGFED